MPRPKKDGTYLNVCIATNVYEQLTEFCQEAGQTKTVAVERALSEYLDDYKKKQEILKSAEEANGN